MDGLGIHVLANEWNEWFAGAKIDKIHQPSARELVLVLRTAGKTYRVLLSAHRQLGRAHVLREVRPSNPQEPPMFCMLLRKRIEGGRISRVWQPGFERVLHLDVDAYNDIGDPVRYILVLEAMGKHSNLVFCLADNEGNPGKVVDAIVHVTPDMSRVRPVLPGQDYTPPPPQDKATIDTLTDAELDKTLAEAMTSKQKERAIMSVLQGVGPETAREALHRAHKSEVSVLESLREVFEHAISKEEPSSLLEDQLGQPVAAAPFWLSYGERIRKVESFDAALERLYEAAIMRSQFSAEYQSIVSSVHDSLDRLRGKLTKLEQQREESRDPDTPRIMGELLMTYAYQVAKGANSVSLPNFYDDENPLTISLDPAQSATQNATQYFKVASKHKRAIPLLAREIEKTQDDILYLESVLANLEQAEPVHYVAIRQELIRQGFLSESKQRQRSHQKGAQKGQKRSHQNNDIGRPDEFRSSDGYTIRVGRNNLQNDRLTLKQAQPDDIWLHVKDAPGSHVVIETGHRNVPETTLHEAALLAAYYSKLRASTNAPVDYTEVRHVWKVNGARPGHVLYDHQKTVYATPDKSLIDQLDQIPAK